MPITINPPAQAGTKAKQAAQIRDFKVSQPRIDQLHPAVRSEVKAVIIEIEKGLPENIAIRIAQGYRSIEEQNEIFAQGRTKPGKIVSKAPGGKSLHNFGLAIDVCLLIGGKEVVWADLKTDIDKDGIPDIKEIAAPFEALNWFWGGNFSSIKDYPHFEKKFGKPDYRFFFGQYNAKKFIPNTKYVVI